VGHSQKRIGGKLIARGTTKTKKSRTLFVPADLLPTLEAHRELQAAQRARYAPDATWNAENLIFTRPDGTPVSKEAYAREFAKVCRAAHIEDATPHALRHTCCTLMKMSNVAVFASFHTVRDEVPPGDMDLSGDVAGRSSRDEALVGPGIHQP
jgi:integrase